MPDIDLGMKKDNTSRPKWIFLGDSLIEFCDWHRRFPEADLLNLGMAGETVEGLLGRLGAMIERLPVPDLVLIMSGTNNVGMEEYEIIVPYEKIVLLLHEKFPAAKIIINSLLPFRLPWISDNSILQVNSSLRQMALENGVDYLDTYNAFLTDEGKTNTNGFLEDGVHLSERGYEIWSSEIENFVI